MNKQIIFCDKLFREFCGLKKSKISGIFLIFRAFYGRMITGERGAFDLFFPFAKQKVQSQKCKAKSAKQGLHCKLDGKEQQGMCVSEVNEYEQMEQ